MLEEYLVFGDDAVSNETIAELFVRFRYDKLDVKDALHTAPANTNDSQ